MAYATAPAAVAGLQSQLVKFTTEAGGSVGISIVHLESGTSASVGGGAPRPLYSVFKLPLAIVALKAVEERKLSLAQKVMVTRDDLSSGVAVNLARWKSAPAEFTIMQLLEASVAWSDNTAADKLMVLLGGPVSVTRRLKELGLDGIEIRAYTREFRPGVESNNRASAEAITDLLAKLQAGALLAPTERKVLFNLMAGSKTGLDRLRGKLPKGTKAMDKTGTGPDGTATNDVGIIELPNSGGHVAVAVLISESTLSAAAQETLIARIGRLAYDAFSKQANQR